MQPLNTIISGILVTVIGALPFGLVNLTVLDVSFHKGSRGAMNIAYGAALTEVLFGLTAILVGNSLRQYTEESLFMNYLVIAILGVTGFVFLLKKNPEQGKSTMKLPGFLKGIVLNLISLQVLLFWLVAVTFLITRKLLNDDPLAVFLFVTGIWLGKMGVLWMYAVLSRIILSKSQFLAKNINRVIGSILLITVLIQLFKL